MSLKQLSLQTLDAPPGNAEPINLLGVYRSLLRIVARLEDQEYTDLQANSRQTAGYQPDDPADPASGSDTSQG